MAYTTPSQIQGIADTAAAAAISPCLVRLSATGINGKSTGITNGETTANNGKFFLVTSVTVHTELAGGITGVPTLSIGTSSGSSNNIMTATAMTGSGVQSRVLNFPLSSTLAIPPNTTWVVNITAAATGTSQTLEVYLNGSYQA